MNLNLELNNSTLLLSWLECCSQMTYTVVAFFATAFLVGSKMVGSLEISIYKSPSADIQWFKYMLEQI
jgi:hypothetical protein